MLLALGKSTHALADGQTDKEQSTPRKPGKHEQADNAPSYIQDPRELQALGHTDGADVLNVECTRKSLKVSMRKKQTNKRRMIRAVTIIFPKKLRISVLFQRCRTLLSRKGNFHCDGHLLDLATPLAKKGRQEVYTICTSCITKNRLTEREPFFWCRRLLLQIGLYRTRSASKKLYKYR